MNTTLHSFGWCSLTCVGCSFKAPLQQTAGQQGNHVFIDACACACVGECLGLQRAVGQRGMWLQCEIANGYQGNAEGNKKLSAPVVRAQWRRRNKARAFSRILSTARRFPHTYSFLTFSDCLLFALFSLSSFIPSSSQIPSPLRLLLS